MTPLLGLEEGRGERLDETFEATGKALHQFGRDLGLGEHLLELKFISSFHIRLSFRVAPSWKLMMQ